MKTLGIKGRLIASFTLVLALVAAGLVPLLLSDLRTIIDTAEERELRGYHRALEGAVAMSTETGAAMAHLVAEIPEVQAAFASGNRARLAELFVPGFKVLKAKAGVSQFQFHLPPATSFLRVHKAEKFGDDLSSFRHTVVESNHTGKDVVGLEKGVAGLGVRAVVPMRHNGEHKGTVEFGLNFGQDFAQGFKQAYGVDVAIHIRDAKEGGFKTIAYTSDTAFLGGDAWESALSGNVTIHRGERDGSPVAALVAPVADFSGKPAAVMEIIMDSSQYAGQYATARTGALITVSVMLVIGLGVAYVLARSISAPLVRITRVMHDLAGGVLDIQVPSTGRRDEVGEMARAVMIFRQQGQDNLKLVAEQDTMRQAAETERKRMLGGIAGEIDSSVGKIAEAVGSASAEMVATAEGMNRLVDDANARAATVAAAAEEASANVATVAAATEELTSSIGEISRQTAESTRIAREAVDEANAADTRINELNNAVIKIGEVVSFITDIAGQTNLLALNATIEAARAGEAGKGFAVVANEVKHLAHQTAKATDEISALINAVQSATHDAVAAIGSIGGVINRMNGVITTIASAVEEQGAATAEISRNVQQAADGTRQVSDNISGVSSVVGETGRAAASVLDAGAELSRQAETLRAEIRHSVTQIRAA